MLVKLGQNTESYNSQYYIITNIGIIIKETDIPAACYEIQCQAEYIIRKHHLSFSVKVECKRMTAQIGHWYYCLEIIVFDAYDYPFGLVEYTTMAIPDNYNLGAYLFRWYSSTITMIPGDKETLEVHFRIIIEHKYQLIH